MLKKQNTPFNPVWVFLGPSLSHTEANNILPAHYAPPIRRGDIEMALNEGAKIIGIIDGSFYRSFSVGPFEIIMAIEKGIKVFGASSMGALKAVECHPFGMIGVGKIYELYQSGKIDAEDEVAIVFDPETLRALSIPLVNMRYAFALAEKEGILNRKEKNTLLRIGKKIYFPERTYKHVFMIAKEKGFSKTKIDQLISYVKDPSRDLKSLDTIECLKSIRNHLEITSK